MSEVCVSIICRFRMMRKLHLKNIQMNIHLKGMCQSRQTKLDGISKSSSVCEWGPNLSRLGSVLWQ